MESKPTATPNWAATDDPGGVLGARSCASTGTWHWTGHEGDEKSPRVSLLGGPVCVAGIDSRGCGPGSLPGARDAGQSTQRSATPSGATHSPCRRDSVETGVRLLNVC